MIRTIIFDWDGTLHNTARLYGCAFRAAYEFLVQEGQAPKHVYCDEDVSCYLGMNPPDMWSTFMPELPQRYKEQAIKLVGEQMVAQIVAGKAQLYAGVEAMLDTLKAQGYTLVVLSNCKHDYMEAHKAAFGLDQWFSAYYCGEDFDYAPKEEIFAAFEEAHPKDFVMIGDRRSDFAVAQAHGLRSIACAYGFGDAEEYTSADLIAHSPADIPALISLAQGM